VRLVMPQVERAHAHRKLDRIDFVERRCMCEKVKRESDEEEKDSFNHGSLARIVMFHLG
jgi:hypothetical protein